MVETSRLVHVIFHRKISKKVGNLPVPWKIMRMKITCTGLYFCFFTPENVKLHCCVGLSIYF